MNFKLALVATVATLALSSNAIAADSTYKAETEIKKDKDGSYTKTTSETGSDNTGASSVKTETDVEVNKDGTVDKTVETEVTKDPKGLMNKEKTKVKDSVKHKDGKAVIKHKKTVNGDTVEDTEKEVR